MNAFFSKCRSLRHPIPALCYGITLAGWLFWGIFCLCGDALGGVTTIRLQPEDFTLINLEQVEENVYFTTNGDPQMILENVSGSPVRNLAIHAEYTKDAREMCLYYTTRPGEDFSQDKRVFAVQNDSGVCTYTLPRKNIYALRLDPCSPAENELLNMTVLSVELNTPQPWWSCFAPGWNGVFKLALWPGMAAALLSILQGLWRMLFADKKGK